MNEILRPAPDVHEPKSALTKQEIWRETTEAERQELFLPVTGFGWFFPEEVKVINHPAFQRLGRINQLGQANLVFRGATHKRIEHVLGAVHMAEKMISAIALNADKAVSLHKNREHGHDHLAPPINEFERRFIRLGALLHDIGHLAAGHTLEDELGLIDQHDGDERIRLLFNGMDWDSVSLPDVREAKQVFKSSLDLSEVQPLGQLIDLEYRDYVPTNLKRAKISASDIVRLLIRKKPSGHDPHQDKQRQLEQSNEIRWLACSSMIGDTICADLLDYLHRDWFHVGKPQYFDDRILQYMEMRRLPGAAGNTDKPHSTDRFVIALGRNPRIRTDGVSAILNLLESRYQLAETVLFHRTKLAAGSMLDRAFFALWSDSGGRIVEKLLSRSDEEVVDFAFQEACSNLARAPTEYRWQVAYRSLACLRQRALFKVVATLAFDEAEHDRRQVLTKLYIPIRGDGIVDQAEQLRSAAKNRAETARLIEEDFGLKPGTVAIYGVDVKAKIAQVSIAVNDEIEQFSAYETNTEGRLSGGHLDAQIKRFKRLWRIHFFIDRMYTDPNSQQNLSDATKRTLQKFIKDVVLFRATQEDLFYRAKDLAQALESEFRVAGRAFRKELEFDESNSGELVFYPNGAPAISNFFDRA